MCNSFNMNEFKIIFKYLYYSLLALLIYRRNEIWRPNCYSRKAENIQIGHIIFKGFWKHKKTETNTQEKLISRQFIFEIFWNHENV